MGPSGSEYCHLLGAGGSFGAKDGVVVVVGNVVGVVDGGCGAVARGDMAGVGGDGGLGIASLRGAICMPALTVVVVSVWVLESFRAVISASFDAIAFATSITSIRWPSSIDTQWP